jgi:hypothetical protein
MTLVLTLISRRYVLHVSDRLVTGAVTGQALDPLANKSIVYLARDAVVVAGYAGLASFGGKPTDEWLAERLLGTGLTRQDNRGAFRFGRLVTYHRDLGQSIMALSAQLEGWPDKMLRGHRLEVVLAGIRWPRRGQPAPFAWTIVKEGRAVETEHLLRRFGRRFQLLSIGHADFDAKIARELVDTIETTLPDPRLTEDAMVSAIRSVAAKRRTRVIGDDCMVILLPRSEPPRIEVRYRPRVEGRARIVGGVRSIVVPAAASPFLVGPEGVMYPSTVAGPGVSFGLGAFSVSIDAPDLPPRTILGAVSSQRRPRLS